MSVSASMASCEVRPNARSAESADSRRLDARAKGVSHAVHFKPKNLPTVRTLRTSQPNVSGVL